MGKAHPATGRKVRRGQLIPADDPAPSSSSSSTEELQLLTLSSAPIANVNTELSSTSLETIIENGNGEEYSPTSENSGNSSPTLEIIMRPTFDPLLHSLDESFRLTNFFNKRGHKRMEIMTPTPSISPLLRHEGLSSVECMELLYPIVDDPYMQGRIACLNALGPLYSVGVTCIDSLLMLLGIPPKMSEKERDVVVPLIIRGFKVSNNLLFI
jgi:hypothetical protein